MLLLQFEGYALKNHVCAVYLLFLLYVMDVNS